ncbi:hypothetical protein KUTeg_021779 [Tegillarca granosa]|uniref:Uncharacterized protein n=1 Tax=Tegillarca granosa TaxID=220873 RepID=A0ABQ9E571_TEGGR|nr:hypothetical protein KUTeg_021779 [Tegillarca granosa]
MDLEDTYRSNEDEISYQIEPIRNISSKKWLNSAGVSLANLNQIQASVYNIGLVDAKNLRAPSSLSREKRSGSYGDISATPPLSTVSLQKTCNTWGSNNSIPDLIKQHVQADGTKLQRPESAKYNSVRRQRPSSGKKTRPQSATTHESQLPPKPPGIAVKGSKCDPAGRPLKYSPQQSVNTGWVGPPAGMKFPDNPSQDLSRILTSEPSSPPPPPQGTPAPPIGTPGPPSAPRASPIPIPFGDDGEDESVQTNENSVPEFKYTKGNPQVSPILLRKPTPEPIHLSLPTMEDEEVDEEQEENMNTDRLLELAEEKSSLLTRADIHSTNSDNLAMFNEKTDSLETASHNSAYHQNHIISTDEDHMVIESDGDWSVDEEVEDQPHPLSKSTVTFCEDNNVTIDITPRNMGYKVNDGPTSPNQRNQVYKMRPKNYS